MKQLAPGVYVDVDKTLHIDAAELCIANGYEPTAENQAKLEAAARLLLTPKGGVVDVVEPGKDQPCR